MGCFPKRWSRRREASGEEDAAPRIRNRWREDGPEMVPGWRKEVLRNAREDDEEVERELERQEREEYDYPEVQLPPPAVMRAHYYAVQRRVIEWNGGREENRRSLRREADLLGERVPELWNIQTEIQEPIEMQAMSNNTSNNGLSPARDPFLSSPLSDESSQLRIIPSRRRRERRQEEEEEEEEEGEEEEVEVVEEQLPAYDDPPPYSPLTADIHASLEDGDIARAAW
jgi:hypothetical protein